MSNTALFNKPIAQVHLKEVINNFTHTHGIIFLSYESSLKDALQLFSQHKIHSAPVLDEQKNCIGMVDILDIVAFVRDVYFANKETSQLKNILLQFAFEVQHVKNVMDLSKRNPFVTLKLNSTVPDLIEKFSQGVHRVAITSDDGEVVHIISQIDMFRFIFEKDVLNFKKFTTPLLTKNAIELNLGQLKSQQKKIVTVPENTIVIDAFKMMSENGFSEIGVVDAATGEHLVTTLAARDLEGFLDEEASLLLCDIAQFKYHVLKKREQQEDEDSPIKNLKQPKLDVSLVFIKENSPFKQVVERLGKTHARRIYIMKGETLSHIEGIVSLTDIFRLVLQLIK